MEKEVKLKELFQSGTIGEVRKKLLGYTYLPTGSRIRYHEAFFETKTLSRIQKFLEQQDSSLLEGVEKCPLSTLQMQCYLCSHNEAAWVQLCEYVPHRYAPVTNVVKLEGAAATAIAKLFGR